MKNDFWKALVLILVFSQACVLNLNAQTNFTLEKVGSNSYTDGILKGKLFKFKHVFNNDPAHLKLFNKYNRTRKTQAIINYSSLGITAVGILYASELSSQANGFNDAVNAVIGLGAILVGPTIMILSNPIFFIVKSNRKRKLLNAYDPSLVINEVDNIIELNLAMTQNGIGLVYNF